MPFTHRVAEPVPAYFGKKKISSSTSMRAMEIVFQSTWLFLWSFACKGATVEALERFVLFMWIVFGDSF